MNHGWREGGVVEDVLGIAHGRVDAGFMYACRMRDRGGDKMIMNQDEGLTDVGGKVEE
jgi:hypothetical protein